MERACVAKRKAWGGHRQGAGRKPDPAKPSRSILGIGGTPEWRAFVDRFAEFGRAASAAELIDRALEHYAKAQGYPGPIPRR